MDASLPASVSDPTSPGLANLGEDPTNLRDVGPVGQFDAETPTQIPPGKYEVTYVRHELRSLFGGRALKLVVWFRVVSAGDGFGALLPKYYNVKKADGKPRSAIAFKVGFKSTFYRDYVRIVQCPSKRRDRVTPDRFKGRVLLVRVRNVECDSKQQPIAKGAQYSVIDEIVGDAT